MSEPWTDREVRVALGLSPERADPETVFLRVTTDSRSVEEGDLFVALVGERFDGHDFVADAFARGAAGAVVAREVTVSEGARLYPVSDTLHALGLLAGHRRRSLKARVVGVTGSSGKTMTKEFLAGALRGSFRVHATPGNLNNRIGLPLTLLDAPRDAQVLILEMGTNEPGEVKTLSEIAAPTLGVITTVSETHLEKLGSLEGVMEEKLDLLRSLPEGAVAVVGEDPPALAERARALGLEVRVAGWGTAADASLRPERTEPLEGGRYRFLWREEPVELLIPGRHAVQNALLALGVAEALGVAPRLAARRVSRVEPVAMRSEVRPLGSLTLLVDCYNANPQSVRAALQVLVEMQALGARVAVLGSMLELGPRARVLHREVLEEALALPLDLIVVTGLFAEAAEWVSLPERGPELRVERDVEAVGPWLAERLNGTEVVLLKGSRGVALERVLPALEDRFGPVAGNASAGPPLRKEA